MLMPSSFLASGRRILFSRPAARFAGQNGCVAKLERPGAFSTPGPGHGAHLFIWHMFAGLVGLLSYRESLQTVFPGFARAGVHLPKVILTGWICVRFGRTWSLN